MWVGGEGTETHTRNMKQKILEHGRRDVVVGGGDLLITCIIQSSKAEVNL